MADDFVCPATLGPDCAGFMCLFCGRRVGSYLDYLNDDPGGGDG